MCEGSACGCVCRRRYQLFVVIRRVGWLDLVLYGSRTYARAPFGILQTVVAFAVSEHELELARGDPVAFHSCSARF